MRTARRVGAAVAQHINSTLPRRWLARWSSGARVVEENDIVLLRSANRRTAGSGKPFLTPPLRTTSRVNVAYGDEVLGSEVIGRRLDEFVRTEHGRSVQVLEATLSQYLTLVPRKVTPIYPHDAYLLVSLLDIDLPQPGEEEGEAIPSGSPPFEIFEAGTGHGSLTLHLARAIHAANPPLPAHLRRALADEEGPNRSSGSSDGGGGDVCRPLSAEEAALVDAYRRGARRAVVRTLDVNAEHSGAARRMVRRFRRGRYAGDVDFHVGSIAAYLEARRREERVAAGDRGDGESTDVPFLAHAVLDLPSPEDEIAHVSAALKVGGKVLVWCPHVTQMVRVLERVTGAGGVQNMEKLPLVLDRVLELVTTAVNGATDAGVAGARDWDLRLAERRPAAGAGAGDGGGSVSERLEALRERRRRRQREEGEAGPDMAEAEGGDIVEGGTTTVAGARVLVCRPKAGAQVVGGGFVGVFRKVAA